MNTILHNERAAAGRLGLAVAWLRSEARAGRLPSITAGRRLLFDIELVRAALAQRAEAEQRARATAQRTEGKP